MASFILQGLLSELYLSQGYSFGIYIPPPINPVLEEAIFFENQQHAREIPYGILSITVPSGTIKNNFYFNQKNNIIVCLG